MVSQRVWTHSSSSSSSPPPPLYSPYSLFLLFLVFPIPVLLIPLCSSTEMTVQQKFDEDWSYSDCRVETRTNWGNQRTTIIRTRTSTRTDTVWEIDDVGPAHLKEESQDFTDGCLLPPAGRILSLILPPAGLILFLLLSPLLHQNSWGKSTTLSDRPKSIYFNLL